MLVPASNVNKVKPDSIKLFISPPAYASPEVALKHTLSNRHA